MAGKSVAKPRKLSVYLYIPNIIGYIRVLMNCVAFAICFSNKRLFSALYFISFVCDGVDGWCARKFNQVSTFGAVLDMVTDRISTACLLVILSHVYRPGLIFLLLLALDIASHWLQMYSTFLTGKVSHKDVKDSTNWLFRAYYGNRMFMAFCCVACEVLYIMLFLRAEKQTDDLIDVLMTSARQSPILLVLLALSLFGWTIKQTVNVIQIIHFDLLRFVFLEWDAGGFLHVYIRFKFIEDTDDRKGAPQALLQSCLTFGAFSFVIEGLKKQQPALAYPYVRKRHVQKDLPTLPALPLPLPLPDELKGAFSSFCESLRKPNKGKKTITH